MPLPRNKQHKAKRTKGQRAVLAKRALERRREAWTILRDALPEDMRAPLPPKFDDAAEFAGYSLQQPGAIEQPARAIKAALAYCELHFGELIYPTERETEPSEWNFDRLRRSMFPPSPNITLGAMQGVSSSENLQGGGGGGGGEEGAAAAPLGEALDAEGVLVDPPTPPAAADL